MNSNIGIYTAVVFNLYRGRFPHFGGSDEELSSLDLKFGSYAHAYLYVDFRGLKSPIQVKTWEVVCLMQWGHVMRNLSIRHPDSDRYRYTCIITRSRADSAAQSSHNTWALPNLRRGAACKEGTPLRSSSCHQRLCPTQGRDSMRMMELVRWGCRSPSIMAHQVVRYVRRKIIRTRWASWKTNT